LRVAWKTGDIKKQTTLRQPVSSELPGNKAGLAFCVIGHTPDFAFRIAS
jgi:hypothetical protein